MSDSNSSTPQAFITEVELVQDASSSQPVGLVRLEDDRKRRRELESSQNSGGKSTMKRIDGETASGISFKKKKRKGAARKLLSFDEHEDEQDVAASVASSARKTTPDSAESELGLARPREVRRKLKTKPNANLPAPKVITKASLAAEATERERLRVEFLEIQEQVRETNIAIPFVFYDGSNVPGGTVKIKKGEHIWLFLERCRKLGAEMGVSSQGSVEGGGTKQRVDGKKSWARIGVDDLMMVRGSTVIPHHYEFYHFIANNVADPNRPGQLLFGYTGADAVVSLDGEQSVLRVPKDQVVEGQDDDPAVTKVVDRRWYERNKHIYPSSQWRDYKSDSDKTSAQDGKRDAVGNSFFFT